MALVTSMYGIAGVLGPTLGGLITDTRQLTWRFCFWFVAPTIANLSEHQRANFSRINLRKCLIRRIPKYLMLYSGWSCDLRDRILDF